MMNSQRSEHKVVLPDEVWSETLIQATLNRKQPARFVTTSYVTMWVYPQKISRQSSSTSDQVNNALFT